MTKKINLEKLAQAVGGTVVVAGNVSDKQLKDFHTVAFEFLAKYGFKKPDAGDQSKLKIGDVEIMITWRDGRTDYSFDVSVLNSEACFGMGEWCSVKAGAKALVRFQNQVASAVTFAKALAKAVEKKPKFLAS